MVTVGKLTLPFDLMGIKDVEAISVKRGMDIDHKHVHYI
jgi:hypothetical protein